MTTHSLQIIHASLPVAVTVTSSFMVAAKPPPAKNAKEIEEPVPLDIRAGKITSLLACIHGYEHGGLND